MCAYVVAGTNDRGPGPIEAIVQRSQDGAARIVRRRFPEQWAPRLGWQDWVVEFLIDGVWRRSANGPWDYLCNARNEMKGSMKTLTVRELYDRLAALHRETDGFRGKAGSMEVILRVQDDDGGTMVGGLTSLAVDPGCTEVDALVMDGATDAESNTTLEEVTYGDS
jgi:hypothetical protein